MSAWIERLQRPLLARLQEPGGCAVEPTRKRALAAAIVCAECTVVAVLLLLWLADSSAQRWAIGVVWTAAMSYVISLAVNPVPAARTVVAVLALLLLVLPLAFLVLLVVLALK